MCLGDSWLQRLSTITQTNNIHTSNLRTWDQSCYSPNHLKTLMFSSHSSAFVTPSQQHSTQHWPSRTIPVALRTRGFLRRRTCKSISEGFSRSHEVYRYMSCSAAQSFTLNTPLWLINAGVPAVVRQCTTWSRRREAFRYSDYYFVSLFSFFLSFIVNFNNVIA